MFGGNLLLLAAALAAQSEAAQPMPPVRDGLAVPGRPGGNPGKWVTLGDYPADAKRERREGVTAFRVWYDKRGLPSKCDVMESSGHTDLDTATCALVMRRARFKPGRNREGETVGGYYMNKIRWTVPRTAF